MNQSLSPEERQAKLEKEREKIDKLMEDVRELQGEQGPFTGPKSTTAPGAVTPVPRFP